MTENDIKGNFLAIRELALRLAGADLPNAKRQAIQTLVDCSLTLLEGFLLDINRIADACVEPPKHDWAEQDPTWRAALDSNEHD